MGGPKIMVVDYHKGNLSSVVRGLARAGAAACTSDDPEQICNADGLVIPGVGAFYDAIAFMRRSGEEAAVLDAVAAGIPLLGICLGLQLFFERGNEGVPADEGVVADGSASEQDGGPWVDGLGIMRGSCTRLESSRLKVPHVGWDQVHMTSAGAADPLLAGFAEGANMYFTHSYAVADDAMPPMCWRSRTIRGASRASCAMATCGAASSIPRNPPRWVSASLRTS